MSISPNTLKFHYEKLEMIKEKLQAAFPFDPIKPTDLPADIYYKAGQASVVFYINNLLEEDDVH